MELIYTFLRHVYKREAIYDIVYIKCILILYYLKQEFINIYN